MRLFTLKPSLSDAYLRVVRANEHLQELKALCGEVCAAQAKSTVIQTQPNLTINPGEAKMPFVVQTGTAVIPDRCKILIGDTAVSLRSALNYLVGQLSRLDSGSGKKGKHTQFPIESSANDFNGRKRRYLEGLTEAHIAAIERLQPYNGCDWMQPLQKLSNLDKHDELVIVAHDYSMTIEASTTPAEGGGVVLSNMKVKLQPTLRIALGDGMPVIETLETIQSQVTQTLDSFNPLFKA